MVYINIIQYHQVLKHVLYINLVLDKVSDCVLNNEWMNIAQLEYGLKGTLRIQGVYILNEIDFNL